MDEFKNINSDRLWQSLEEMAKIGATSKGGVARLALTELDRIGRDLFVNWCKDAGCTIEIDKIGNIYAVRPGRDNELPPISMGSHLDSQPTGGKYDGVYGVLAGLEVIRSLNDQGVETVAPVAAIVWTNEEGARFSPAMIASGVFGGAFDLDYGLSRQDKEGTTIADALEQIGYAGSLGVGEKKLGAHVELHIEQGPILESEGLTIGCVGGVQGIRWYDLLIFGDEVHAGPTPMDQRNDPVLKLSQFLTWIYAAIEQFGSDARLTVGELSSEPGSRNTVPGLVSLTLDLRHPDENSLKEMHQLLTSKVESLKGQDWKLELREEWYSPPVVFDHKVCSAVSDSAQSLGYQSRPMVSGAGHDSVYVSRVAPTGMIFIPCKNGISHNEAESINQSDCAAGADVLFGAITSLAGVVK